MKKVLNSLTYDYKQVKGEVNTLPSKTIPDQSMTIKQILERHSRGLPMLGQKVPMYDDTEELTVDPRTMDLTDVQEELDNIAGRMAQRKRTRDEAKRPKPQPTPPKPTQPNDPEQSSLPLE